MTIIRKFKNLIILCSIFWISPEDLKFQKPIGTIRVWCGDRYFIFPRFSIQHCCNLYHAKCNPQKTTTDSKAPVGRNRDESRRREAVKNREHILVGLSINSYLTQEYRRRHRDPSEGSRFGRTEMYETACM